MKISIDYDLTYTANPAMWESIIEIMQQHGCEVYCITKRYPGHGEKIEISVPVIHAIKSKMEAAKAAGLSIDIWIDDKPHTITPYSLINRNASRAIQKQARR